MNDRKPDARVANALALVESGSNAPDGEKLAALAAVERLLAKNGLRLRDLAPSNTEGPKPNRHAIHDWRQVCGLSLKEIELLSDWEIKFLTNLRTFGSISPKQKLALQKIAARLGVDGRHV